MVLNYSFSLKTLVEDFNFIIYSTTFSFISIKVLIEHNLVQ